MSSADLETFLAEHQDGILRIQKSVPLEPRGRAHRPVQPDHPLRESRELPGLSPGRSALRQSQGAGARARLRSRAGGAHAWPKSCAKVRSPCTPLPTPPVTSVSTPATTWISRCCPSSATPSIDPYPYTTSFAIHRELGTGSLNQMYPRCGVLSRNEMVDVVRHSHGQSHARPSIAPPGSACRRPSSIGVHPAWELCGCYSHPHDSWWEMELFEAITGCPGQVVRCKTVDLVVPADASIVIEGFLSPTRTAQDGPSPGPTMLFTPYADAAAGVRSHCHHHAQPAHLPQSPDDAVHRSSGDAAAVSRGHHL